MTPPTPTPEDLAPTLAVPLDTESKDIGSLHYWTDEIAKARKRRKPEVEKGKKNLDRTYRATRDKMMGFTRDEGITVPTDFYFVEQKKSALFFQTPFVQAAGEMVETEQAAPYFQHVVNFELSSKSANVKRTVDECLTDVLVSMGIGPSIIGYERVTATVQMPTGRMVPQTDPTGQPIVDPVSGQPAMTPALDPTTGQPETQPVDQTVWDRFFWEHFSPAQLLIPAGWLSTDYDAAPWLGREKDLDPEQIGDKFKVSTHSLGTPASTEDTMAPEADREYLQRGGLLVEVWYRARLYDPTAPQELYRRLVLVSLKDKGRAKGGQWLPVIHEDCLYQDFDPNGKLMNDFRGNPIHPLTIRRVTDTAYPPSDCEIARQTADELSVSRSQMLKQRNRNVPVRAFNKLKVPPDIIKRLQRGDQQALIPWEGPVLDQDFRALGQSAFPNENFAFNNIINQDLQLIWGMGPNNLGVTNSGDRSATELTIADRSSDARVNADRVAVLEWFQMGVQNKFAPLLQKFGDDARMLEILGPDGRTKIATWNKQQIQGRYAFTLAPDSSQRIDQTERANLGIRRFNLTANSPYVDQRENVMELFRDLGKDPSRFVPPPQPPAPPPPEKPKIQLSFKGDDLNPLMPQYLNVIKVLEATGVEGLAPPQTAPALAAGSPLPTTPPPVPTPAVPLSAAKRVPPVNKHDSDLTGDRSGPKVQ